MCIRDRAYTGRSKVVKFSGCYHGHADGLLVKAGSGAMTHGIPTSAGVPEAYAAETLVAEYNDVASVEAFFQAWPDAIAGVIVEPVAGNMGVVPPAEGFLESLRLLTAQNGAMLIFDEVITGFRIAYGGAQTRYGVTPDITCLGKIIGGGLPVGAYGGSREIMEMVAPLGPMYQAGTLSGNPLAVTAGLTTLTELGREGTYERLEALSARLAKLGARLEAGLADAGREAGIDLQVNRLGSVLTPFFTAAPVRDYEGATAADTAAYARFFRGMLARGVYPPPSQFEGWFLSAAHTRRDVDEAVEAARATLTGMRRRPRAAGGR